MYKNIIGMPPKKKATVAKKKPATAAAKKKAAAKKPKAADGVRYTVEPIDIDADGVPDGDLVTKYVNGVVESKRFVPLETLKKQIKKEAAKAKKKSPAKKKAVAAPRVNQQPQYQQQPYQQQQQPMGYGNDYGYDEQMGYNRGGPQQPQDSRVLVADDTSFGQYLKQGVGVTAGRIATEQAFNALGSLFSGEEE